MRAPVFWNEAGFIAYLLLPLSWCYALAGKIRRLFCTPEKLSVPVICVGNITAGGAGKTPVALHVGALLKDAGFNAFFLSRGYGGKLSGPVLVDEKIHSAKDVGDEPLLLCRKLPTIVAKDRLAGARCAIEKGADIIVMDDGLQNPSIEKTLSLLVIDGSIGFGNRFLIPAGPLREPVWQAINRVDALIVINPNEDRSIGGMKRLFSAITQPVNADFIKDKRWFAFCGIAYPHKFLNTLHNLRAHVLGSQSFVDHHPYTIHEIDTLRKKAALLGAELITTSKDMVRIPEALRTGVHVLHIELLIDNQQAFCDFILAKIKAS